MVISTRNLKQEYATPEKEAAASGVVEEPVVEEVVVEDKGIGLNKYEDDNDGNKEGQLCADTCIIL
jgi:predicted lipoprotein with Yx(FWY)xxD motif